MWVNPRDLNLCSETCLVLEWGRWEVPGNPSHCYTDAPWDNHRTLSTLTLPTCISQSPQGRRMLEGHEPSLPSSTWSPLQVEDGRGLGQSWGKGGQAKPGPSGVGSRGALVYPREVRRLQEARPRVEPRLQALPLHVLHVPLDVNSKS